MSATAPNESIVPVFFGPGSNLYGCYHLSADYEHAPALLICQPIGHEYERCHRAMRQLAVQAAKKGWSSMRFDYYSTGNSAGNYEELSLARMRDDIQQAIGCCREKTGADHLTLVGLRLGATLATQLASSCPEIDSLVLYAPVFDGEILLTEWQQEQYEFYAKHSHLQQPTTTDEILGFPVTQDFRLEISRQFIPPTASSTLKRVLILTDSAETFPAAVGEWLDTLKQQGIAVTEEATGDIAVWRREPMDAIVPVKTIRRIVKWLGEAAHA
jgi:alpha/beta superfamily hydrolase